MPARAVTWALSAGTVVVLAFSSGGFFPSEWGLAMLLFELLLLGVVVLRSELACSRAGLVFLAALAAFGGWQLLSVMWSGSAGVPVIEAERTLLYLVAAAALVVCLVPATVQALLDGVIAGATAVSLYALGTRLAPGSLGGAYDPSSGYQLAKPIGYWNALALLMVFALLFGTAVALGRRGAMAGAAAAAAVPLAACLYFTFSRGALGTLAVGLAVLVGVRPDRLRGALRAAAFLALPAVGVLLASREAALTAPGASLQTAQAQGHRLILQLVVVTVVAAVAYPMVSASIERVAPAAVWRRALAVALAAAVLVGCAVGLVAAGGPFTFTERARTAFTAPPPAVESGYGRRLLSVSGHGRSAYWTVAETMVRHHPLLGDGAGSFARAWARERPVANGAQDAHNLYLETLAELGPVGLVLLLIALVAPALVVRRVRINASASAAAAGLAAFVVHAAIDWDWEIPVLTLSAIACAAVLVVLDPDRRTLPLTTPRRVAGVAVVAASLATALIVHVGNRAASDARQALASGDGAMALAAAERAQAWMPWNPAGNQLLGEALLAEKRDALARSALQEAVQRDPADWSIWYDLARASRGSERANALTRARELNPLSIEVGTLAADT